MKIIILGAGQVGSSLAQHLAREANDITVVDNRGEVLRELQERLDLRTICGFAAHPDVISSAGGADADMVIAVTNSDEVNMIACQVAQTLFRTPAKIARVRSAAYLAYPELCTAENSALPIDVVISPEQLVTNHVERLITHPGALQVVDFADGRLQMVGVKAMEGGAAVGKPVRFIAEHLPEVNMRIAAIFRDGSNIKPEGSVVIEPGDEVFFLASPTQIKALTAEFREADKPYKRIMIAGGGNIGMRLASILEGRYKVKLIEPDLGRTRYLAEVLNKTIILHGDAADEELLREENVGSMDVFVSLTNKDEANILSAMLARRLGARKTMALVNRPGYSQMIENGLVDIAISPQEITLGALLTRVRRGDIVAVHSMRKGSSEAIEAIAHGDRKTSKVVGRMIEELKLPEGIRFSALVRGETVIIVHHDTVIQPEDHVIIFVADKRKLPEVERMFQVKVTYL
jgi:trk system potassium uptake protein TrkA